MFLTNTFGTLGNVKYRYNFLIQYLFYNCMKSFANFREQLMIISISKNFSFGFSWNLLSL